MLIDVIGYRDWARRLYDMARENYGGITSEDLGTLWHWHDSTEFSRCCFRADLTFLVGWSEIVPESFYDRDRVVMVLHPSPLPRYRGGSPIQHQIIGGETESAISIFRLQSDYPEVDSGPLAIQLPFSLEGSLADVLERIAKVGEIAVRSVVQSAEAGTLTFMPQPEGGWSLPRRKPAESEITMQELEAWSGYRLANKVRALQDPYPNAFIRTAEGGRLYITEARWEPPGPDAPIRIADCPVHPIARKFPIEGSFTRFRCEFCSHILEVEVVEP